MLSPHSWDNDWSLFSYHLAIKLEYSDTLTFTQTPLGSTQIRLSRLEEVVERFNISLTAFIIKYCRNCGWRDRGTDIGDLEGWMVVVTLGVGKWRPTHVYTRVRNTRPKYSSSHNEVWVCVMCCYWTVQGLECVIFWCNIIVFLCSIQPLSASHYPDLILHMYGLYEVKFMDWTL